MKTFKQFLEEASNVIQSIRKSGWYLEKGGYKDKDKPSNMMNYGWQILKAKRSKDDKINGQYKDINTPVKPKDPPLDPYAIPVKKA